MGWGGGRGGHKWGGLIHSMKKIEICNENAIYLKRVCHIFRSGTSIALTIGGPWGIIENVVHHVLNVCIAIIMDKKDRWDSRKPCPPTNSLFHPDQSGNKLLANICMPYRSPTTKNLVDHDFDLQGHLRSNVIGLALYGFVLMVNGNIWPNSAPLRDIRL